MPDRKPPSLGISTQPRATPIACVAIVLLVLAVFGRSLGYGFLDYDDRFHIHENTRLLEPGPGRFTHFWTHPHGRLYVPLAYNLFALQAAASDRGPDTPPRERFDPRVFRVTSIALHAASAVLVLLILRRLGVAVPAAFLGAAAFAVHPLQVEPVAWISEQRGLLSTSLALASALIYLIATRSRDAASMRAQWSCWILALLLYVASMFAKPSSAPLPAILAVIDITLRRRSWSSTAAKLALWLLAGAALLVATRWLQPAADLRALAPLWQRPLIACDSIVFYLRALVWPFGLSPDHARTPAHVATIWEGWWLRLVWIIPVLILVLLWRCRSRAPFTLAGLLVFVFCLGPVLGLVTFHHQEISTVADRYASLGLLGVAIIAAFGFTQLTRRRDAALALAIGVAVLTSLSLRSFDQTKHWRDDSTLWSHTTRVSPNSSVAHNNLGFAHYSRTELDPALHHFRRAVELDPNGAVPHANLGMILDDLGRLDEAELFLRRSLELNPMNPRTLTLLGELLARRGDLDQAEHHLRRAVEIDPSHPEATNSLGLVLLSLGRPHEALQRLRRAVELDPRSAAAYHNLALAHASLGDDTQAIDGYSRSSELDPLNPIILRNLAHAQINAGDIAAAVDSYRAALRLDPLDAATHNNLGLALVQLGNFTQAEEAFSQAVRILPDLPGAQDNLRNIRIIIELQRQQAEPGASPGSADP